MKQTTPLPSALLARFRSNLDLKLLLMLTLPLVTAGAYFAVQRMILFPTRSLPITWLDRATPFQPAWVWAYLSLYLLNPVGPLLTRSREDLLWYTRGILFLFAFGIVFFVLLPVAGPRPSAYEGNWLYNRLVHIDRVYNSFPSLHAGCAVYAVLYAAYASGDTSRRKLRKVLLACAWVWVCLILYSTIATRQHFAIDLLPGILLAWLARTLFFERHPERTRCKRGVLVGGESA